MTPAYYQSVQGDLYDEFVRDYGQEVVRLHLIMQAREYLKRAHQKGQRASDLGKVRVILARLLEWEEAGEDEERYEPMPMDPLTPAEADTLYAALEHRPMKLDEMATILSASGYLVREGRLSEEDWQAIGKKEGYTQAPKMDEAAWRNIGEHYGYFWHMPEEVWQRIGRKKGWIFLNPPSILGDVHVPKRKLDYCACGHHVSAHAMRESLIEGLAPCKLCTCHSYDAGGAENNSIWQEDAQGFTVTPTGPTVLEHCLAADQARQGVAVRSEVVELLSRAHIPYNGLWTDHAAEVDRLFHERWPWEPKEVG